MVPRVRSVRYVFLRIPRTGTGLKVTRYVSLSI